MRVSGAGDPRTWTEGAACFVAPPRPVYLARAEGKRGKRRTVDILRQLSEAEMCLADWKVAAGGTRGPPVDKQQLSITPLPQWGCGSRPEWAQQTRPCPASFFDTTGIPDNALGKEEAAAPDAGPTTTEPAFDNGPRASAVARRLRLKRQSERRSVRSSIRISVLVVVVFLSVVFDASGGGSVSDEWNRFREKNIDQIGDDIDDELKRATDDLNRFREKYIDPIGDARSVDELIDATGAAVIKIASTPLKVTYEGVSWVAEETNDELIKPIAKHFKESWDELQSADPQTPEHSTYDPGPWVEKIRVVNYLAGDIVIATGGTHPKSFKNSLVWFTIPTKQGRKLRLPERLEQETISVFIEWHPSYCKDIAEFMIGVDRCWTRIHYGIHKLPLSISVTYDKFNRIAVKWDADSLIQDLS